jgi:LEA14-like dessication related protein
VYNEVMRRSSLVALAFLLSACAGMQELARSAVKAPKLTFRSASIQGLDMEGATVGFTFDLENPNGFGVDLARIGWTIDAEGTRVAAGDLPGGLQIRANGTAPINFPVRVRFQDVPGIVSLLGSGKDAIGYRLGGTVGIRTPIGILDLPLSHEDRLKLPSVPRFALEGISIRSVTFSELALDVRVRVKNPNGFALPVGRLDYALAVSGAPVAHADGVDLSGVAAGSSAVVAIPVRFAVGSAGRAAADLARGAEVPVELTGRAHVGGIPLPLDLRARMPARR